MKRHWNGNVLTTPRRQELNLVTSRRATAVGAASDAFLPAAAGAGCAATLLSTGGGGKKEEGTGYCHAESEREGR